MFPLVLPSFRRQQLVLDFSFLKDRCPEGLYLSLTPGDASLWVAALFVRKGPYEGAILRFQLSFPDTYPDIPPLIIFSSDVFHPLVVPLTTYTFSTHTVDASTTVSASDENRLPPGAFSLRHGFPEWFSTHLRGENDGAPDVTALDAARPETFNLQAPDKDKSTVSDHSDDEPTERKTLILNVLQHLQHAFENEMFLDNIPLDAVGDPSAWHAWRAHRGHSKQRNGTESLHLSAKEASPSSPKNPAEWKWDGVWESRVRNGVEASISEAALFGSTSSGPRAGSIPKESATMDPRRVLLAVADRQIRFSKLSDERYEELKAAFSESGSPVPPS